MSETSTNSYSDEVISLKDLFLILLRKKWWVVIITWLFVSISIGVALYLPSEYKATVVVQPNANGKGGKLGSLSGQIGGLASLAGINLNNSESSNAVVAEEVMKSWGFIENFIKQHELSPLLMGVKNWDQLNDKLVFDETIYNEKNNTWVANGASKNNTAPSSWRLYEEFKDRLRVNKIKETGFVSISFIYYDPKIARNIVDLLVEDINHYMKERSLKEANESIKYLEEHIRQTSIAEIRTVFSELIQEQHKTKMLAQVSDEFVFKTIAAAKVPEKKDKPRRFFIVLVGAFLGFISSVFIVIILDFMKRDI